MGAYFCIDRDGGDPEVCFDPRPQRDDSPGVLRIFVGGATVVIEGMDAASIEKFGYAALSASESARKYEANVEVDVVPPSVLIADV